MASQCELNWQSSKKTVLERSRHMFNNPLMSNITFTCGGSKQKHFNSHKYVLATSSPVFYTMFYGDLAEMSSNIELPDTDEESLEAFLRFLYTDECNVTPDQALNVLYLSKKYMIPSLDERCVKIISDNLNPDNVITVLDQAIRFNETNLGEKCWDFVDLHTRPTIQSDAFLDINTDTLRDLLKRDTLKISEIELFQAVMRWSDHQCELNDLNKTLANRRSLLGDMVYQLRLLLMTKSEITQEIIPAELLTAKEVAPILEKFDGLDNGDLMWPIVKHRSYFVRAPCCRVSVKSSRQGFVNGWMSWISRKFDEDSGDSWHFRMWNTSYLRFKVDTPVMLHGVRLLGDADDIEYEVGVEIEGVSHSIYGSYRATFEELNATHGFDVMLPTPVFVRPREFIGISVSIREPQSYYVVTKLETSKAGGITVNFEHQYTKRGDICEIIFRVAGNDRP